MLLRNKLVSLRLLAVILLGFLLSGQIFAQTPTTNSQSQPNFQPGQQGKVDGGVIQPLDNGQSGASAQTQPANGQSQQQPAQNQQPGQQGQNDNGLIMPIDNGTQPPASGQATQPTQNQQTGQQPATQGQTPVPNSPNQPSDTVQVPAGQGGKGKAPDSEAGGQFTFRATVEEVRLHATVVDDRQRLVTSLDKSAFTVFENGAQQQITSFRHEDVPVAMGVIIDNSGSMREKRPAVNKAAINLVKASNPEDEVFVVNFNDDFYLDQDYTDNVPKLHDALERYETRGGTALYDAVLASNDHLMKAPKLEKKVLFVVTDGEDDASLNTLEQTIRRVQLENGPTIYAIGILDEQGSHKRRAQRALRELTEATGGVAFFPSSLDEVDRITQQIAHDIRNQYTISYKPIDPQSHGGYRSVKVEARARGYGKLSVRTRSGYYAGGKPSGGSPKAASQPASAAVR